MKLTSLFVNIYIYIYIYIYMITKTNDCENGWIVKMCLQISNI